LERGGVGLGLESRSGRPFVGQFAVEVNTAVTKSDVDCVPGVCSGLPSQASTPGIGCGTWRELTPSATANGIQLVAPDVERADRQGRSNRRFQPFR